MLGVCLPFRVRSPSINAFFFFSPSIDSLFLSICIQFVTGEPPPRIRIIAFASLKLVSTTRYLLFMLCGGTCRNRGRRCCACNENHAFPLWNSLIGFNDSITIATATSATSATSKITSVQNPNERKNRCSSYIDAQQSTIQWSWMSCVLAIAIGILSSVRSNNRII